MNNGTCITPGPSYIWFSIFDQVANATTVQIDQASPLGDQIALRVRRPARHRVPAADRHVRPRLDRGAAAAGVQRHRRRTAAGPPSRSSPASRPWSRRCSPTPTWPVRDGRRSPARRPSRARPRRGRSPRRARRAPFGVDSAPCHASASSTRASAASPCSAPSWPRCPRADTVYLGDTARVPYGTKSAETVTQYSLRNARLLAPQRHRPPRRRLQHRLGGGAARARAPSSPIPVLGVVEPGARAAAARASRTGRIGVIGTQGTVASGAYQAALRRERPGAEVIARACPLFVPLAEEGWTDPEDEVVRGVVRRYLAPLREARRSTRSSSAARTTRCSRRPSPRELPGVALVDSARGDRGRGAGALRRRRPGPGARTGSSSPTRRRSSSPWRAASSAAR